MNSSVRNEMAVQMDNPFVRQASEEADSSMTSLELKEIISMVPVILSQLPSFASAAPCDELVDEI